MNNSGSSLQSDYENPNSFSPSEMQRWAVLAHLSVLLNLFTGFLGIVAALVIYLVYKERSPYVAFHAMQSFVMQVILWFGGGVLAGIAWTISSMLTGLFFLGCILMPIAALISFAPLIAVVYGLLGALKISQGDDFRYWLIGDWVDKLLNAG